MAVRSEGSRKITLPGINNLVHLDYEGSVLNAVVDFVEADASGHALLTLCLTAALPKGETCFWMDERKKRHLATVEESLTDWGMTTIRLRIGAPQVAAGSHRTADRS
jgi:hypothetical protein